MILRLAQYGLLFVSALLVARDLGPDDRARYALPLALAAGVASLLHLSLEGAAGRLLARDEATAAQLTRALAGCTVLLGAISLLVALVASAVARQDLLAGASQTTVLLAVATIPFLFAIQMAGYMLMVLGGLRAYAIAAASAASGQLALVGVLVAFGDLTVATATFATLLGFAATGVGMVFALGRVVGGRALVPAFDRELPRQLVVIGLSMHGGSVALQLGGRVDLLIVGGMTSTREVGLYSLAVTLSDAVFLASRTLAMTALERQVGDEEAAAISYTVDFTRRSLRFAFAAAAGACAVAYPLILLLYGTAWKGTVLPFVVLVVATIAIALEAPTRSLLMRIARPLWVSVLACSSLALNIVLTVMLIPPLGIIGAALGSVGAYWAYALATAAVFARVAHVPITTLFRAGRPIEAAAVGEARPRLR